MSRSVRLLWTEANGAEHIRDFGAEAEALDAVALGSADWADWVIVERTRPGRYAVVGRVLHTSEAPLLARAKHEDCDCSQCLPATF